MILESENRMLRAALLLIAKEVEDHKDAVPGIVLETARLVALYAFHSHHGGHHESPNPVRAFLGALLRRADRRGQDELPEGGVPARHAEQVRAEIAGFAPVAAGGEADPAARRRLSE